MPHRARMRHPSLEGLSNRPRRPTVRWRRHRGNVKKSIFYSSDNGIRRLFRWSLFLIQILRKYLANGSHTDYTVMQLYAISTWEG